jgi:hypothetical protein
MKHERKQEAPSTLSQNRKQGGERNNNLRNIKRIENQKYIMMSGI